MKTSFRRVKAGIIMSIILLSICATMCTSSSAGLINIKPLISVTHNRAEDNVIPKSGVLDINLSTSFTLTGLGATYVQTSSLLKDSSITISLELQEASDWIDASITNSPAKLKIAEPGTTWQSKLSLTVTEKAPAFTLGKVKITATSTSLRGLLFNLQETTEVFEVPFEIGYWPVVNYELKEGNFKEVGPLDTAVFPIALKNLGNGVTYIQIEPIDSLGEDWTVSIPSSVTLNSDDMLGEDGTMATVRLTIKPPYDFGFHNDRKTFKVRFTPSYLGSPNLVGQSEVITFNVQSIGVSPGAGYEIPLILTVLVVIFIGFYVWRKSKK